MDINKNQKIYQGGTQSVMNIICENTKDINYLWNITGLSENSNWGNDFDKLISKAKLLHFTGSRKPWLSGEINRNYFEEWYVYLSNIEIVLLEEINKIVSKRLTYLLDQNSENLDILIKDFKSKII